MLTLLLSILVAVPSSAADPAVPDLGSPEKMLHGQAGNVLVAPRADAPTVPEAQAFMASTEETLYGLFRKSRHAGWVQQTNINYDTEWIAADADREYAAKAAQLAREARRFDDLPLPAELKRKFLFLKLAVDSPAPPDLKEQKELSDTKIWLDSTYGKGKYCPDSASTCLTLDDMDDILKSSRDPARLLEIWKGWRTISPPMRPRYERLVELSNKGARDLGFADTADLWRSAYDMKPEEFSAELDRVWLQLKPLYESLHAYVRERLATQYPGQIGADGLIPAHLLGNMWAQEWQGVYPLVAPPQAPGSFDLTERLRAKKLDEKEMVKYGERFFTSLGLEPLPATFWERSMLTKPRDREVVCHASALDVDSSQDIRIKMCIKIQSEDFVTIHHELGHNFYQRAYEKQPFFFRNSANDGFHEALGDTIALSVTPGYLKQVGLIDEVPGTEGDVDLLLRMALERVAFQPFGLLVDKWRWGVFTGKIKPAEYNEAWWDLVRKYQGLKPPVMRSEADFDPGAKYHIPGNVPYARYFLAAVYQFQLYRALCKQHGHSGPLHRCSFYGDKAVGKRLNDMMAMGMSRPWPDALEAATGQRQLDATAILEYFAPLKAWLDERNRGQTVGWKTE